MPGKIKWLLVLTAAVVVFLLLNPAFGLQAEEEGSDPILSSLWSQDNQETGQLIEEPWEGKPEAPPFNGKPGKADPERIPGPKSPESEAFEEETSDQRYGQGYWKRWLAANEDYTCPSGFTAGELLAMLHTPARGDANNILLYQFIAAALNADVNGFEMPGENDTGESDVKTAFDEAFNHLELLFQGEDSGATREEILRWKDILEQWNEG